MPLNFENHAAKGNEFMNELTKEFGKYMNREQAGRILIAFLRTLRIHLTLQENLQFMAQLPIALKVVYVDQWKLSHYHERIRTLDAFISKMVEVDAGAGWRDFHNREDAEKIIRSVLRVLGKYVSAGEMDDIAAILPKELKEFFMSEIPRRI